MAVYERQTPETSLMYRVVARQWPRIVADYNAHGVTIPSYVSAEVERFLRCGILQYGFLRLRCPACDAEKVIGFSCKTRGLCSRCGARRHEQAAIRLESEVWPQVGARQWVLTFPYQVRRFLVLSEPLMTAVIRVVNDEISKLYIAHTPELSDCLSTAHAATGSMTFVHRFNSALDRSPHLHLIFADGVWGRKDGKRQYFPFRPLTSDDVVKVLFALEKRLTKLLRKKGFIRGYGPDIEEEPQDMPEGPFQPRQPKAFRRDFQSPKWSEIDRDKMTNLGHCNATFRWLSLHAAVYVEPDDREGLMSLFRYC